MINHSETMLPPARKDTTMSSVISTTPAAHETVVANGEKALSPTQAVMPVTTGGDSLTEILRNPLHDTHDFKLACNECVLRIGHKVIDFK